MIRLFNCQKMTELASLSYERPLSVSQRLGMRIHFLLCPKCRDFDQNIRSLKQIIAKHKAHDGE